MWQALNRAVLAAPSSSVSVQGMLWPVPLCRLREGGREVRGRKEGREGGMDGEREGGEGGREGGR